MRDVILCIGVFVVLYSCKAQQTYPLNTNYNNITNYSYLKDLNNELDPYIGKYEASYNGNQITLYINKQENKLISYGEQKFYRDVLSIKFIIKNSSGVILQDTQSTNSQANQIYSLRINSQLGVDLSYEGTNCSIGWGKIILKKLNATQISWEYRPNSLIIDSVTCPPSTDKTVYLPVTKDLIFTKQ